MKTNTTLAKTSTAIGLATLAWVFALGGCAAAERPQEILRIWPEPPAQARIYLRRIIASSDDVTRPGGLADFFGLVAGRSRQRIQQPQGIAVGADDKLYVVDQGLQGVHVFDLKEGKFSFIEQVAKDQYFVSPVGVAVCGELVAVSDSNLNKVFLFNAKGAVERVIEKPGGFGRPTGLACDPANGELYVVDTVASEVCVFSPAGELVRRFGEPGKDDGQFNVPTHVFVSQDGTVYVSDSLNSRIQLFDRAGKFVSGFGQLGDASGHLATPKGVGADGFGHIYVADSTLATMQVFDRAGRLLLGFGERGSGAGSFEMPTGVAVRGNMIYVCDFYAGRVQIFEYIGREDESQPDE